MTALSPRSLFVTTKTAAATSSTVVVDNKGAKPSPDALARVTLSRWAPRWASSMMRMLPPVALYIHV